MGKQDNPQYLPKDTVEVGAIEERFKVLREAYLEGRLTVDSRQLAERLMDFELFLNKSLSSSPKKM